MIEKKKEPDESHAGVGQYEPVSRATLQVHSRLKIAPRHVLHELAEHCRWFPEQEWLNEVLNGASRMLSWLLRHSKKSDADKESTRLGKPKAEGTPNEWLPMDTGGWANVTNVMDILCHHHNEFQILVGTVRKMIPYRLEEFLQAIL